MLGRNGRIALLHVAVGFVLKAAKFCRPQLVIPALSCGASNRAISRGARVIALSRRGPTGHRARRRVTVVSRCVVELLFSDLVTVGLHVLPCLRIELAMRMRARRIARYRSGRVGPSVRKNVAVVRKFELVA